MNYYKIIYNHCYGLAAVAAVLMDKMTRFFIYVP